jgi:Uma2 family endonuclease
MSTMSPPEETEVVYPESDGQPMADNTKQWDWIATIKINLDDLFRDRPDVFVAGDLLWYPVQGRPDIRVAPDAMIAFGRPKGDRRSYLQWKEGGIAPQVVFEILSPGKRAGAMEQKRLFYEQYGVEEYYLYDPDTYELVSWLRDGEALGLVQDMQGWISHRLGIRFEPLADGLRIVRPDGRPFETFIDVARQRDEVTRQRDEVVRQRDELARERDELARRRDEADRQRERAERLAAKLRALGLEPEP